jgi:hypothetical protein
MTVDGIDRIGRRKESFEPSLADIRLCEIAGIRSILDASQTNRLVELSWSASHFDMIMISSRCVQS